jgi:hypothetical protein
MVCSGRIAGQSWCYDRGSGATASRHLRSVLASSPEITLDRTMNFVCVILRRRTYILANYSGYQCVHDVEQS